VRSYSKPLVKAPPDGGSRTVRINDPSGAPVPGAAIAVKNIETSVVEKTTSTETGDHQVPFLAPGNYTVTVEHAGFRKLV